MFEYAFLFLVALVWLCFAVVQDVRTREISNWLNFSLLVVALLYRAIYSKASGDYYFFFLGIGGTIFFMCLAYLLYYSKAFAGGDAKLLMALGPIIPFKSISDYILLGFGFVFVLFLLGSVYSMIYTGFMAYRKRKAFVRQFYNFIFGSKKLLFFSLFCGLFLSLLFLWIGSGIFYSLLFLVAFSLLPILYSYGKAVESCCFIKKVSANLLTEGDWLVHDVRVRGITIKASLQGLNKKEIYLLKKAKFKVSIKEGVPFSPAFLLAFLVMVFYALG